MKEKLKKQRKSITIKIASVLLIVWLIVSLIFSAITLTVEKQTQLTYEHNNYDYFVECITGMSAPPYNEMLKYVDIVKTHSRDIVTGDLVPEMTCGADGTYDTDLQLVLFEVGLEENGDYTMLMDSDKEIYVSFILDDFDSSTANSGILNYDEFVSSMTQKQLDTIVEHLNIKKDKDGYFYLLRCTQTYYNPENGHIYPKTIEIVKSYEDSNGYAVAEVKDTFELNPEVTDSFELYECYGNESCIIDGQFVCNNFSSGGLIDDPYEPIDYESYDPDVGIVKKTGMFTYLYTNGGTYSINTLGFEASEHAKEYKQAEDYFYDELAGEVFYNDEWEFKVEEFENEVGYLEKDIGIRYVKHINLLEYCADTLIIGTAAIFLFFLIIGIILTIMMYKVIKTQLIEEEKRREVTNALAHDIKTPLFIISGYAQNLKENVNTQKREHYCDRIIERTDEVNSLVHKMLDFSKLGETEQKLSLESVDIKSLVNSVIEDYYNLPDTKIIKFAAIGDCTVNADKDLLKRALTYLLDNAVRYSLDNTEIDIKLSEKFLSISNVCEKISEKDIKHLTDPYFRVEKNRESKGNGLGLSIVKSILELHFFDLSIELKENLITFTIKF